MNALLSAVAGLVEEAVYGEPPADLSHVCRAHYRPYYYLMHMLADCVGHMLPHGVCVELGVEKGRGSASMALADQTVFGVDHTRHGEIAVLQRMFPRFVFLEENSTPVPAVIAQQKHRIPLLHIDTGHSYGQARQEWEAYEPLLTDPAVVLFDDTHAMADDVARFVVSLKHPMIFDERLHECGYAVVVYTREGK